jgi:hypothetical protein
VGNKEKSGLKKESEERTAENMSSAQEGTRSLPRTWVDGWGKGEGLTIVEKTEYHVGKTR